MSAEYKLITVHEDNFFVSMRTLEIRVNAALCEGWQVSGGLVVREDVKYRVADPKALYGYRDKTATFFTQPMIRPAEARLASERKWRMKFFGKMLRRKRVLAHIANGVTLTELAERYQRKPSTIKEWRNAAREMDDWLAEDPELMRLFNEYEANHPEVS